MTNAIIMTTYVHLMGFLRGHLLHSGPVWRGEGTTGWLWLAVALQLSIEQLVTAAELLAVS